MITPVPNTTRPSPVTTGAPSRDSPTPATPVPDKHLRINTSLAYSSNGRHAPLYPCLPAPPRPAPPSPLCH
ncbi:hypothetical protein E2C01_050634 [Portunus trituberculatus]|uniref:Uncharacterized protein n=1 Tax=Portunus trituberculatus TaxID=210409 RepID=A0A5B7GGP0_PORTR|nr:hypothetical protein [Portunus trituberculatus]